MKRTDEAVLLDFCAQQCRGVDVSAWAHFGASNKDRLAVVAFLLASMRWYGNRDELLAVAEQLHHGCASDFPALAAGVDFDCGRFSEMLKARLSHEHSVV